MKIAIQLFGHLRSFRDTFSYIQENILDIYDCDVFMHTWSEEEHSDPTWHQMEHKKPNPTQRKTIYQHYPLKGLDIEDNANIKGEGFFNTSNNISLRALKAMLHSQFRVNQIRNNYQKETGVEYDYVITLRPDVMPLTKLDLTLYEAEFDFQPECSIHFTNGNHYHYQKTKAIFTPLASDLFFLAQPKTMDTLCSAIDDFERYFIDFTNVNDGGISSPEASFIERLYQKGVTPRFYSFPYIVKRTTGDGHLVAGLKQIEHYPHKVIIPDFIKSKMIQKDGLLLRCFAKLSTRHINKVQKELTRTARKIQQFSERLDHKKN